MVALTFSRTHPRLRAPEQIVVTLLDRGVPKKDS